MTLTPEQVEEADEYPQWKLAAHAIENGECAAQLEIQDQELRQSLIRNVAAMMQSAIAAAAQGAREEAAKVAEAHRPDEDRAQWDTVPADIARAIREGAR